MLILNSWLIFRSGISYWTHHQLDPRQTISHAVMKLSDSPWSFWFNPCWLSRWNSKVSRLKPQEKILWSPGGPGLMLPSFTRLKQKHQSLGEGLPILFESKRWLLTITSYLMFISFSKPNILIHSSTKLRIAYHNETWLLVCVEMPWRSSNCAHNHLNFRGQTPSVVALPNTSDYVNFCFLRNKQN